MLWHAMPPELNTARLMAGAGPAPMLQAAAGWEALANALETEAVELSAALVSLQASWTGMGSERAEAATTPMVTWLHAAAKQAQQRALQATAQAAAYAKAMAMTPSVPEIATNRISHAVLTATNFLGINMVPIGFNEVDYFVRMWTQAATTMDIYQAETVANTTFEPLAPMKPILQPAAGAAEALQSLSTAAVEASPAAVGALAELADDIPASTPEIPALAQQLVQFMGQMGQLSGPMQQLTQPFQQFTSLASQTRSLGGADDNLADDDPAGLIGDDGAQLGLMGASPLSNHPLAGGLGPSVGLGLMHAEALPGAGGSASRTSLMSQLLDKPAAVAAPGAGSSAVSGAAPMGMVGGGVQSGAGSKPGLAAPPLQAPQHDEIDYDELGEQDDW